MGTPLLKQAKRCLSFLPAFGVYGGKERLLDRGMHVLPFGEFARELGAGRVLR